MEQVFFIADFHLGDHDVCLQEEPGGHFGVVNCVANDIILLNLQ